MNVTMQDSFEQLMAIEDELSGDTMTPAPLIDPDEALDEAAQGRMLTSEDNTSDVIGEIDAIGRAAGLVVRDDKPFRGIDEVERRDVHRWELDPASAEDTTD